MKKLIKKTFPWLTKILNQIYNHLVHLKYKNRQIKDVFTDIYLINHWKDDNSISGTGSNLMQTEEIRKEIPKLIEKYSIRSVIDVPCGDFHWFQKMHLNLEYYLGGDIVDDLINENTKEYANERRQFKIIDVTKDPLPKSDLVFCRDCLVHLSYLDIEKAILNIKNSNSKYLLTTTFANHNNRNIITGNWRQINLQNPPFNFKVPIAIINENCTEGGKENEDKSLALWEISNLI